MDPRVLIKEISRSDVTDCADSTVLIEMENWDSLKSVRLILRMEEILGRSLSEADIEQLNSIGDIGRLLKEVG